MKQGKLWVSGYAYFIPTNIPYCPWNSLLICLALPLNNDDDKLEGGIPVDDGFWEEK